MEPVVEDSGQVLDEAAANLGATFETWTQWAAGTDPYPVPYLVPAVGCCGFRKGESPDGSPRSLSSNAAFQTVPPSACRT